MRAHLTIYSICDGSRLILRSWNFKWIGLCFVLGKTSDSGFRIWLIFAQHFRTANPNEKAINSDSSFINSGKFSVRQKKSKSRPSLSSHFMLLTLFNASLCFRILFSFEIVIRQTIAYLIVERASFPPFRITNANLIIFAWLLIYSFARFGEGWSKILAYLDLCRFVRCASSFSPSTEEKQNIFRV